MKVTLSWLRDFAPDIDGDPVELGETLSALGLAVEEYYSYKSVFTKSLQLVG